MSDLSGKVDTLVNTCCCAWHLGSSPFSFRYIRTDAAILNSFFFLLNEFGPEPGQLPRVAGP